MELQKLRTRFAGTGDRSNLESSATGGQVKEVRVDYEIGQDKAMRVFIVGATGWIGGAIADKFLLAKHAVTGLVRSEDAAQRLRSRGAEPMRGDLTDSAAMNAPALEADAIIYAAAASPDGGKVAKLLPAATCPLETLSA